VSLETIAAAVRNVPDFPQPGIQFKDISPILQSPALFRESIDLLCAPYAAQPPDTIVAIDARGFLFGAAMAYKLGCGLAMVRKKGKLPWRTVASSYALEYGTNSIELHADACAPGARVLLVDDVLATGGTARAALGLIEQIGGRVTGVAFFLELCFLHGRDHFRQCPVHSLVKVQ
jgi:adenine phosphoribosyltransferase